MSDDATQEVTVETLDSGDGEVLVFSTKHYVQYVVDSALKGRISRHYTD